VFGLDQSAGHAGGGWGSGCASLGGKARWFYGALCWRDWLAGVLAMLGLVQCQRLEPGIHAIRWVVLGLCFCFGPGRIPLASARGAEVSVFALFPLVLPTGAEMALGSQAMTYALALQKKKKNGGLPGLHLLVLLQVHGCSKRSWPVVSRVMGAG